MGWNLVSAAWTGLHLWGWKIALRDWWHGTEPLQENVATEAVKMEKLRTRQFFYSPQVRNPFVCASHVWNFLFYVENLIDSYVLFFERDEKLFSLEKKKVDRWGISEFLPKICLESA